MAQTGGARRRLRRYGAGFTGCMYGASLLAQYSQRARWLLWLVLVLLAVASGCWVVAAREMKRLTQE